jgi:hypothetical protein
MIEALLAGGAKSSSSSVARDMQAPRFPCAFSLHLCASRGWRGSFRRRNLRPRVPLEASGAGGSVGAGEVRGARGERGSSSAETVTQAAAAAFSLSLEFIMPFAGSAGGG